MEDDVDGRQKLINQIMEVDFLKGNRERKALSKLNTERITPEQPTNATPQQQCQLLVTDRSHDDNGLAGWAPRPDDVNASNPEYQNLNVNVMDYADANMELYRRRKGSLYDSCERPSEDED